MKTTITRNTLYRLVREALADTPRIGPKQSIRIMQEADAIKKFPLGLWWVREDECGCIVGNILGGKPKTTKTALFEFGIKVDEAIRTHVGCSYDDLCVDNIKYIKVAG